MELMKQQITLEIVYEAATKRPEFWNWEALVDHVEEESVKMINAKPPERVDNLAERGRLTDRNE